MAVVSGYIDEKELEVAATKLGFPFKSKGELKATFVAIDKDNNGRITQVHTPHAHPCRPASLTLLLLPDPLFAVLTSDLRFFMAGRVHRVVEQVLGERILEEASPLSYHDGGERGRHR